LYEHSIDDDSNESTSVKQTTQKLKKKTSTKDDVFLETIKTIKSAIVEQRNIHIDKLKSSDQNVVECFQTFDRLTIRWSPKIKGEEVTRWIEGSALYYSEIMDESYKYDYDHIREHLIEKMGPTDRWFCLETEFYASRK
jgi:hypothetical protein